MTLYLLRSQDALDGYLGRSCGCGDELGESDSGDDESRTGERAGAEMLMQKDQRGEPGEDGFERENDGGVRGREMLLRPALDGEGGRRCEDAGDDQRNDETWREAGVGVFAEG